MTSVPSHPESDVCKPRCKRRSLLLPGLVTLAAMLAPASGLAQDAPAVKDRAAPAASPPAKPLLDPPYVDGSFGFSVQPPAGATLYREKQIGDSDVEIARFVILPVQWSFTIRITTTTRPLDPQTIVDGLTAKLGSQHQEFKVLKGESAPIAGREGVRYAASFKAQGMDWIRQQAVIPNQETEYFTLVFITPLTDRQLAESYFDQIVASFKILRDERTRERIKAALERGTKLLNQASTGQIDLGSKVVQDNYLKCVVGGKEIGYVRVSERLGKRDNRRGYLVREWGWLFNADGSITHLEHDMFLALDFSFERWDKRLYELPAEQPNANRQLQVSLENAVRESDQLGVAYLPRPNAIEKRDKLITVEKSYSPAAWNVLFPRLIDLTKPELYAFSAYNSDRRGMVLRTLDVQTLDKILIDGQQISAYKIEDSEGLLPPASQIFVDTHGKVLRLVAGPVEMVATTGKYIDEKYSAKVAEAQDLFKKLQPQLPTPNTAPWPSGARQPSQDLPSNPGPIRP